MSRVSDFFIVKLDTLRKTALLAGGLRLLFCFCRSNIRNTTPRKTASSSFNGELAFSVWRMNADLARTS